MQPLLRFHPTDQSGFDASFCCIHACPGTARQARPRQALWNVESTLHAVAKGFGDATADRTNQFDVETTASAAVACTVASTVACPASTVACPACTVACTVADVAGTKVDFSFFLHVPSNMFAARSHLLDDCGDTCAASAALQVLGLPKAVTTP